MPHNSPISESANRVYAELGSKSTQEATGDHEVSNYYVAVSALIFALVAVGHLVRISKRWTVKIGPLAVPMSVSWAGFVIAALLSTWGIMQLGQ